MRNNNVLAAKIARELELAGQNVRKYYQRRLPSNPSKDYYYLHRNTPNNETVIVEYGFADSSGDDINQLKNNWQTLAEAVTKAIVEYAGGRYTAPLNDNYYIVKNGDTLWSIAKRLKVSLNELKKANNLTGNLINVGQKLLIPKKITNPQENTYIVQKDDNLYQIAKKFNTTVAKLKSINNLQTDKLAIGQVLKLPNKITNDTYIVQKGDNLYQIAKTFDTTVAELKDINNLTSNLLSIGQVLKIPFNSKEPKIYTVKSGDNLYRIAQNFNTTVNKLIDLNNLANTNLKIGQKLLIP